MSLKKVLEHWTKEGVNQKEADEQQKPRQSWRHQTIPGGAGWVLTEDSVIQADDI